MRRFESDVCIIGGGISAALLSQKLRELRPNATIIKEGERGNTFYVIVQGGVRVLAQGLNEEAKEVARLGAGAFFGEMAVFNDEPRTASVTAIGEVQCFAFEKQAVLDILHDYPRIKQVLGLVGLKRAEHLIDVQMKD